MKLTKQQWLDSVNVTSERNLRLLDKAYDVLKENTVCHDKLPWGARPAIVPWNVKGTGIWNWDSAFHALGASRFDTDLAQSCIDIFSEYQLENGMLPDCIMIDDSRIEDRITKPPVMPWAALEVYKRSGNKAFLERCYKSGVKYESFWENERESNGMFYYSAQKDVEKDNYIMPRYESGWDNSPRWDNGIINLFPVDLNCFMVMLYRSLSEMAEILGKPNEAVLCHRRKAQALSEKIESTMFDENIGAYTDIDRFTGTHSEVLSPASFMPLYIGIASEKHAKAIEKCALDKNKFYPGMPSVAYDDNAYSTDYWRGPTWLNIAYFAAKGLKNYGFDTAADGIKDYILSMADKNLENGIFENYDSKEQKGLCWKYFSWSAVFIMEFILNF